MSRVGPACCCPKPAPSLLGSEAALGLVKSWVKIMGHAKWILPSLSASRLLIKPPVNVLCVIFTPTQRLFGDEYNLIISVLVMTMIILHSPN